MVHEMMSNHIKTGSEDWYSCSGHRNYEPPYSKHQWLSLSAGHHTSEAAGPQIRHVSSIIFFFICFCGKLHINIILTYVSYSGPGNLFRPQLDCTHPH